MEDNMDTPIVDTVEVVQEEPTVVVPEPVAVIEEPTPVEPTPTVEPVYTGPVVVGGSDKDDVHLSKCVYKNIYARKSLSVHHLQRRLTEIGFPEASSDKDGWLGDSTKSAIQAFQSSKGLPATGEVDTSTLTEIFKGDPHVTVVLD